MVLYMIYDIHDIIMYGIIIAARSVFHTGQKYYPQVF